MDSDAPLGQAEKSGLKEGEYEPTQESEQPNLCFLPNRG